MINTNVLIFLVLLIFMGGCAGTHIKSTESPAVSSSLDLKKYRKMAVIVHVERRWYRPDRSRAKLIESGVISALLKKGHTVPSRGSDLAKVRKELNLQNSSVTDTDAARLGKILNVKAVLVVDLTDLKRKRIGSGSYAVAMTHATLSGKMIDVETGEILWVGRKAGSINEKYGSTPDLLSDLARKLPIEL